MSLLSVAGCDATPAAPVVIDSLSGAVFGVDRTPLPGMSVAIGDDVVTADAGGRFSFAHVTSPYDLAIDSGASTEPYVFLGLTGAAPTVTLYDRVSSASPTDAQADVTLHLPVTGTDQVTFILDRPEEMAPVEADGLATPSASGEFPLLVTWPGSGPAKVRIQAFRYQAAADGTPQHYTGYATTEMTLQPYAKPEWTATWQTPTFQEATVSITTSQPPGYEILSSQLLTRQNGATNGQGFALSNGSAEAVSFVVPALDGPIFVVQVCAYNGFSTSCRTQPGLAAGTSRALTVDPGPELALQTFSVGVGTEIDWSANGTGAGFVLLVPASATPPAPWYFLATGGASLTIPDLTRLGTKLPKGSDYFLTVYREDSTPTVDALAAGGPGFTPPDGAPSTTAYTPAVAVTAL